MTGALQLMVADDDEPTRTGMRLALEEAGFEVVAEATDAEEAVEAALRERPAGCLLNVYMPRGGGITAARRIKEALPGTAVIMLTASAEDADLFAALEAGAEGYLPADMPGDRLADAVRGVLLEGEAALPRQLTARVLSALRAAHANGVTIGPRRISDRLTNREREVARLLLDGCSTGAIALRLGTSPVTVRRHMSAIMRKAGATDRRAALHLLRAEIGESGASTTGTTR